MRISSIAIVLAGLAASNGAVAQPQMELNAQAGRELTASDRALTSTYQLLMAKLDPAGQAALRTAQRSWLQFREQECAFETMDSLGGSIHPMELAGCMVQLNQERLAKLKSQLQCGEGDLSCHR